MYKSRKKCDHLGHNWSIDVDIPGNSSASVLAQGGADGRLSCSAFGTSQHERTVVRIHTYGVIVPPVRGRGQYYVLLVHYKVPIFRNFRSPVNTYNWRTVVLEIDGPSTHTYVYSTYAYTYVCTPYKASN